MNELMYLKEKKEREFLGIISIVNCEEYKTFNICDPNNNSNIISFIINNDNSIIGTDRKQQLYVGVISDGLSSVIFKYGDGDARPKCFDGKFNIGTRCLVGNWYSYSCFSEKLKKMKALYRDSLIFNIIDSDDLNYVDLLVQKAYERVKNSNFICRYDKEILDEMLGIKQEKEKTLQKLLNNTN